MELILREPLDKIWADQDVFEIAAGLEGQVIRDKEGRQTLKFELQGKTYYRKLHTGIGWREILKNFSQVKMPVIGASNEWLAINRIRNLGLDTLTPVAYGKKGLNPARQRSFLITEELRDTLSLAVYAEGWPSQPPPPAQRRALITKVAEIARTIHRAGINHRDLYICHFLLDQSQAARQNMLSPRLFLVDLHRAQIRKTVPRRWQIKDLASIYFSCLDIGLTRRDVLRFLRVYFDQPLRLTLTWENKLLGQVSRRAVKLYRRDFGRVPRLP
ncbi:MAG TPA: lipopolysaccharide core heptose(I) kinase RfaP [Porticoccaceae bacterium]|nr:lipopolysaccharide core heptose(I) kinase RfaP [Porticoccaceae bacterium]